MGAGAGAGVFGAAGGGPWQADKKTGNEHNVNNKKCFFIN
jgi:hypothetical protein